MSVKLNAFYFGDVHIWVTETFKQKGMSWSVIVIFLFIETIIVLWSYDIS